MTRGEIQVLQADPAFVKTWSGYQQEYRDSALCISATVQHKPLPNYRKFRRCSDGKMICRTALDKECGHQYSQKHQAQSSLHREMSLVVPGSSFRSVM